MTDFIALFPGQGSQSVGMMQNLSTSMVVKKTFEEASDILNINFWDMVNIENTDINQTINTQPLMLAAGIATWRVLEENDIFHPSYAAGHSLGEFTALVAAKVFTFEEGLRIVRKRAELMQNAVPSDKGAMAAILGLADSEVIKICQNLRAKGVIEAVNFNSPGQVVVAGEKNIIESSLEVFKSAGAKRAIVLPVSVPSHCSLMKEAANEFKEFLDAIVFEEPIFPVVQNFEAASYDQLDKIKDGLFYQLFNPVKWTQTIEFIAAKNVNTFLEIGPGKVLTSLGKRINKEKNYISIDSIESLERFKEI
ncbi:MAG: ACP S-malonyltransferase [Nitrosomonadales bacterium]|nr:ACP S-malonyltransferase [Nitrosomonadales bacterium]MBT4571450.1 ACP S-malonyltransferase [Nitrosomonadales bacterium]